MTISDLTLENIFMKGGEVFRVFTFTDARTAVCECVKGKFGITVKLSNQFELTQYLLLALLSES